MRYPVAILAVAAVALAACDRPANTAYNNSGKSAATAPGPTTEDASAPKATSSGAATSDTASPSLAPDASRDETATSARILAAITSEAGMKDADVSVKTENGVVTLAGTAKTRDQVSIATDIAQKQQGVARVESQIALN